MRRNLHRLAYAVLASATLTIAAAPPMRWTA